MPSKKRALGRGLEALLPARPAPAITGDGAAEGALALAAAPLTDTASAYQVLGIDDIEPNPHQPRENFDEAALAELASSIRVHGVLQPVAVVVRDGKNRIVAGERRWRAARLAGLESIPAVFLDLNDQEVLECALVENLQREDLNPVEAARAYKALVDTFGLSHEEVAERVGLSRPAVANSLRLLRLPPDYLKDVEGGYLSAGHARALLSLEREGDRRRLRDAIVRERLSVREAEQMAAQIAERAIAPKKRKSRAAEEPEDANISRLREQLIEALACRVRFRALEPTRGRIEISYDSLDELERILGILGVEA